MSVYTIRELATKLRLLGLDDNSVKILIEDVETLLDFSFEDGIESEQARDYWLNKLDREF